MSLEFNLEIDSSLRLSDLIRVFQLAGLKGILVEESRIYAEGPSSGMAISVQEIVPAREIYAENFKADEAWMVGIVVIFGYPVTGPELPDDEIHRVLEILSIESTAKFVLSLQYEKVFAVRDRLGLRFEDV